jgi:two-component system cell cycle sensor histidine kinase/response regulator CckA
MNPFSTSRLRTRLALMALMAVVPSVTVLLYNGANERSHARADRLHDNKEIVRLVASEQARVLTKGHRLLLTLSQFPALRAQSARECDTVLPSILQDHPDYLNLVVVNADGSPFCAGKSAASQWLKDAPPDARPWLQRAVQTQTAALGDYQFDATTGRPNVVVAQPLLDPAGRVIRVIAVTIPLEQLHPAMSMSLPPTATLALFNRDRTTLARYPEAPRVIGQPMPDTVPSVSPATGAREVADAVGVDGIRTLSITERVAGDFDTGLFVSMSVEYASAFATADRMQSQQLALLGLVSLVTLGAALVGGELFVFRPVKTLQDVTRRLAAGDLAARAQLAGGVPGLHELGNAVNAMADALVARRHERDHVEHQLRSSEDRYRQLFDKSPHAMWVHDPDTLAFLAVNTAAVERYGYSRDEFLRLTVKDLHPLEDRSRLEETRRAGGLGRAGDTWRHRTKEGRSLDVELRVSLVRWNDRSVRMALVDDITERKQLEAQFRQAQKMEAVGQLAGGVAHDFNNLLTTILGYCELLSITDLGESQQNDLAEIRKSGESAARLTRQLLAFSRKQIVELRVWNLGDIVRDLQNMTRRLIGEHISLIVNVSPDLGLSMADRGQIEQVLMNLVVNARDAMPNDGTLTIAADNVDIDTVLPSAPWMPVGPYVRLAVADTGQGMTPDVASHLFEPFFTTKERGKGTGLGLATVYGIVKQSSGHVSVDTAPGCGTTFTIYLPRVEAVDVPDDCQAGDLVTITGTETVVVIDDDASVAAVARRVLQEAGYRTLVANDQVEAFTLCTQERADLLLTDVVMPVENGRALANRSSAVHASLKILFMSGYTDDAIVKHGVLDPGTAFIHKPFSSRELLRKVRDVLDSRAEMAQKHGLLIGAVEADTA